MFNSIFRGVLEAYFLTCLTVIYGLSNAKLSDGEGISDFAVGILLLIGLVVFPIG